jgi:hypothetical protein
MTVDTHNVWISEWGSQIAHNWWWWEVDQAQCVDIGVGEPDCPQLVVVGGGSSTIGGSGGQIAHNWWWWEVDQAQLVVVGARSPTIGGG